MKALFYKDIIALKGNLKALLIVLVFDFVVIKAGFPDMAYLISTFWLIDFVSRTFDTENKNNFYKYVISNAVDEKIIVIYKYILVFLAIILIFLIDFSFTFLTGVDKTIYRFLIFSNLNILLYEILIPIFFRFGKIAREVIRILVGIVYVLGIFYMVKDGRLFSFDIFTNMNIFLIGWLIALVLFVFSFGLSLKFIKKKVE
ncbi:ABC-2 transporter permease [Parvimonas parva]|uniref:ABC-2 transporter permease n=1 Tax=Parvimonas parva TaxID=2769485 RepID=A0ABS1CAB3_9FIRM|nr:ABC-2 transporter permease [Parvimonas parva]MBK1468888.1 ABC-2 transporter permease [Parvimonas parva]